MAVRDDSKIEPSALPPTPADGMGSQSSLVLTSRMSSSSMEVPVSSPSDLKEKMRVLEKARDTPPSKWDVKILTAWLEAGLGK